MEKRRKPGGPVRVVQIDRVDPGFVKSRRVTFRSIFQASEPGGVHEMNVGELTAMRRKALPRVVTQPKVFRRVLGRISGAHGNSFVGVRVFQIKRKVMLRSDALVQFRQAWNMTGQPFPIDLADWAFSTHRTDDSVVIQHRNAVAGQPNVRLKSGCTESNGENEGIKGVLRGMSPCATMRKSNGWIDDSSHGQRA